MICLLTATGGRPNQFAICKSFMERQTYKGDVVWIIVDDCIPVSTDNVKYDFRDDWTIIKVYPKPSWSTGQNTQFRNMIAGIDTLTETYGTKDIRAILIIEDDDYYKADYIEQMVKRLGTYDIIGEGNSLYYNVRLRNHLTWGNTLHSSLFQTAITPKLIPKLIDICKNPSPYPNYYIDVQLWHESENKYLFNAGNLAIGIKGLPGRSGIGAGHDGSFMANQDADGVYLKSLIGSDSSIYESYFGYKDIVPTPSRGRVAVCSRRGRRHFIHKKR